METCPLSDNAKSRKNLGPNFSIELKRLLDAPLCKCLEGVAIGKVLKEGPSTAVPDRQKGTDSRLSGQGTLGIQAATQHLECEVQP